MAPQRLSPSSAVLILARFPAMVATMEIAA